MLFSIANFFAINTAIPPFEISSIKVISAKNLLPVLRTFVAPMLPEPILRISP